MNTMPVAYWSFQKKTRVRPVLGWIRMQKTRKMKLSNIEHLIWSLSQKVNWAFERMNYYFLRFVFKFEGGICKKKLLCH